MSEIVNNVSSNPDDLKFQRIAKLAKVISRSIFVLMGASVAILLLWVGLYTNGDMSQEQSDSLLTVFTVLLTTAGYSLMGAGLFVIVALIWAWNADKRRKDSELEIL